MGGVKIEKIFTIDNNKIIFDKDFFQRLFINPSKKNNKSLSGVALRLAVILLQELDEYHPTEIPQRNSLANTLGVSRTSIINALAQLEEEEFLLRYVSPLEGIIYCDEEKQERMNEIYQKQRDEQKNKRDFSGKFTINSNYNQDDQRLNMDEIMDCVLNQNMETVNNIFDGMKLKSRLKAIEDRIEKLEKQINGVKKIDI